MSNNVSIKRNVSRVQFVDITVPTAWMIDGELWRFRHGTELAIGLDNDLEAAQPVITARVAQELLNAGKAQPSDAISLDGSDAIWVDGDDDRLEAADE